MGNKITHNNIVAARKWVIFAIILCVALWLRFWGLAKAELGADAILSVETARKPDVISVLQHIRREHQGAAPLDFLILHWWINLVGETNLTVQVPAVVWAMLTIVLVFFIGRRLAGDATGLWAMFLLAISPLHIYFSQEARYYALFCFLSMATLWAILRAIDRPILKNWLLVFILASLSFYAHYYTGIVLGIGWLWLLGSLLLSRNESRIFRDTRRKFFQFTLTSFASFLVFLPWFIYKTISEYPNATRPFGLESLRVAWLSLVEFAGTHFINSAIDYGPLMIGLVLFGVGVWAILRNCEKASILLLGFPITLAFVYFVCFKYLYYPTTRQWFFLLPWFVLVEARGITHMMGWVNGDRSGVQRRLYPAATILVAALLTWGPFIQLRDYKRGATSVDSLLVASQKGLSPRDTLVGIGLSPDNVASHLAYANKYAKVAHQVLNADEWLNLYSPERKGENKPLRVVFVSSERNIPYKGPGFYIPPWTYYFPLENEPDTSPNRLLRFIALQKEVLREGYANQSLRLFPSELLRQIATAQMILGETEGAIESLKQAIHLNPLRRDPHAAYAILLESLGREKEAEREWRGAVTGIPPLAEDRVSLGRLLLKRGEPDEAEKFFREALKMQPHHQWAMFCLRQILLNSGRMDEARTFSKKLLKIPDLKNEINWRVKVQDSDPMLMSYLKKLKEPSLLVLTVGFLDDDKYLRNAMINSGNQAKNIGMAALRDLPPFIRSGKPFGKRRRVVFIAAESLENISPFPVEKCGDLWATTPDYLYDDVLHMIRDGLWMQLKLHERHTKKATSLAQAWSYVMLANLSQTLPEHSKDTTAWLRRATELVPDRAFFLLLFGKQLIETGNPEDALKALARAEKLQPNDPEIAVAQANALASLNRVEESIDAFRRTLTLKPDHEWALVGLGELLDKSGHSDEATAIWQKLLSAAKTASNKQKAKKRLQRNSLHN